MALQAVSYFTKCLVSIMSSKVFLGFIWIRFNSIRSRGPRCRAGLADVAVRPLECLQDAQCFFHRSADSVIVNLDAAHHAVRVHDKEPSQGGSVHIILLVGDKDAITVRNSLGNIGDQGNVQSANTAVLSLSSRPG